MGRKIVVTGAAGFVGSNLAKDLLNKGYSVVGIDNLSAGTRENLDARVELHQLDIRDAEIYPLFEGAHAVYHLAAKTSLVYCLAKPLEAVSHNVAGTVNVLEAARRAKVHKLIYADTSAEYEGIHQFPTKEDRVNPIGAYAASKHGGATFCDSYRQLYGMNIVMVRYFNVYGPAQDWRRVIPPVMSAFILKMLRGEQPFVYGTGEKRRDFIYIDDVNDLHLTILEKDEANGRVFNVGSGTNHSVNQIFALIEEILQTGIKPLVKEDLPGEAELTLADISAARSLGWAPRVDIKEGLRRTIAFLQDKVMKSTISVGGLR